MTEAQNDGLNIRFLPCLSKEYPWTVCFRHEPSRGFATREEAEKYISDTRAWRAARAAKEAIKT
jgi:hypothetical protein